VPITTKDVSSNSFHGEVYSIQHYVIKFVGDLQQLVHRIMYCPVFIVFMYSFTLIIRMANLL
jgi:hypothetical protein